MNFRETIFKDKTSYQYYYLDFDQELYFFYMSQFERSKYWWDYGNGNYMGFNEKTSQPNWCINLIYEL